MEEALANPRIIPEGAQFVGFDAKLRAMQPSAEFLKDQSSQPDRLLECVQQLMELKEDEVRKQQTAFTMVTDLWIDVRHGNSNQAAQLVPAMNERLTPPTTSAVQRTLANKIVKPKPIAKQKQQKGILIIDKQKPHKVGAGTRIPSTEREAVAKVVAKYLGSQTIDQLAALMDDAGIRITFLRHDAIRSNKKLQYKDKHGRILSDAPRWTEESYKRAQMHFLLGRALVTVYDEMQGTMERNRRYGPAMYQWLMEKKDVNSLSRLVSAMMEPAARNLPVDGKMVPFRIESIRTLMRVVRNFELKNDGGKGFWPTLGCVVPEEQLLTPVSLTTDDFDTN